ncbi:hypothetical protein J6590_035916 [Homalodisca vitripennis]|nr:hypothetical protein J6590_035916 [Homalodisca vitripennis]
MEESLAAYIRRVEGMLYSNHSPSLYTHVLDCLEYKHKQNAADKHKQIGKARRLKQAKEEAQEEIEKYRQEREKQFKEFEAKHMGSREDVAARIEADTKVKIEEMNRAVTLHKEAEKKTEINQVSFF